MTLYKCTSIVLINTLKINAVKNLLNSILESRNYTEFCNLEMNISKTLIYF
jgi:hypothetical protein